MVQCGVQELLRLVGHRSGVASVAALAGASPLPSLKHHTVLVAVILSAVVGISVFVDDLTILNPILDAVATVPTSFAHAREISPPRHYLVRIFEEAGGFPDWILVLRLTPLRTINELTVSRSLNSNGCDLLLISPF